MARYRKPLLQKGRRRRLGPCSFWYLAENGVRWCFEDERIRLWRIVNLPIVELCVWQRLFGLHGHVQDAGGGFGRHDAVSVILKIDWQIFSVVSESQWRFVQGRVCNCNWNFMRSYRVPMMLDESLPAPMTSAGSR